MTSSAHEGRWNRAKRGMRVMASAYCPDCDEKIVLNPKPQIGKRFKCSNCDAELEVIGTDPLELDWAYDWDWDDDDEEDDDDY
jgi:lysine biosynthesis protein LysW